MRSINRIPHLTKPMLLVAVLTAICTFTVAANAQTWVGNFTLPYEVQWNEEVLPAGEYTMTVDSMSHPAIARVRSTDGKRSIYSLPFVDDSEKGGAGLQVFINGRQRTVRSMNVPQLGVSFVFHPRNIKGAP